MANSKIKKVRIYVGPVGDAFAEFIEAKKDLAHAAQNIEDWNKILTTARGLRTTADISLSGALDALDYATNVYAALEQKISNLEPRNAIREKLEVLLRQLNKNDHDNDYSNGGNKDTAQENVNIINELIAELDAMLDENNPKSIHAELADAIETRDADQRKVEELEDKFKQYIPDDEISPEDQSDIDEQIFIDRLNEIETALNAADVITNAVNEVSESIVSEYETITNEPMFTEDPETPVVYTEETAAAYNATLPNAVHAGDVQTPAVEAQDAIEPANAVYRFTSYSSNDTELDNIYATGTVEVIDPREDGATVKVLTNNPIDTNAEDFVGREFNVNSLDESATLQLFSTDGLALPIYVKVSKVSDAVEAQPAIEAQDAVLYTEETAAAHNAELEGAVKAGDPIKNETDPEVSKVIGKWFIGNNLPDGSEETGWTEVTVIPENIEIDKGDASTVTNWYVVIPSSWEFKPYDSSTGERDEEAFNEDTASIMDVDYDVFYVEERTILRTAFKHF